MYGVTGGLHCDHLTRAWAFRRTGVGVGAGSPGRELLVPRMYPHGVKRKEKKKGRPAHRSRRSREGKSGETFGPPCQAASFQPMRSSVEPTWT